MAAEDQTLGDGIKSIFVVVGILTLVVGLTMFGVPAKAGVGSVSAQGGPALDQWWPWPLRSELITQFFGALFTGVGIGAFWAARQKQWAQVRALFPPGLTFTAMATIAAALHFGSFRPERLATWLFFALYATVFGAGLVTFIRYERRR